MNATRPTLVTDTAHTPASTPKIIRLEGLSKHFGAHRVLENIDLDVAQGEVLAIIGPSGSGKSTLLRCINYLEKPDGGMITVGKLRLDATQEPRKAQLKELRNTVGMVFQSFNLFPHMSVLRNVSLPQERVLGRSRAEAEERALQLLERVG
ncbi:MAG: ATP-binding cassette domain-containing protein, partial [Brucella intermedia]